MALVTLVQVLPRDAGTGATVPVRLAGGGVRPYFQLGFKDWRSGVARPPRFRAGFTFDQQGFRAGALPQTAAIRFAPSDASYLTTLNGYLWDGARIIVSTGDDEDAAPVYTTVVTGVVAGAKKSGGSITFTITDLSAALDKPVAPDVFAGSGGAEGGDDATGRVKRRSFGYVFNVSGRLLDKAYQIWEFGDPSRRFNAFVMVKDKGLGAGAYVDIAWQGSINATLQALRDAVVPAGGCARAPSISCVKWWTTPAGPLTADIRGDIGSGYVESAPELAALLVALYAPEITISNLAEAKGWKPASCGVHVGDATETVGSLLDRLLVPIGLLWTLSPAGALTFARVTWATDGSAPLRADRVEREFTFKPLRARKLGFQRNYTQHTDAEINATILLATDATYLDGTTLEDRKPAEKGATNSANPDSPFGPDGTVKDQLDTTDKAVNALKLLTDVPDLDDLAQGAQDLFFGIQQQRLAQMADQLRTVADRARFNALTHIEGLPAGPIVQRIDVERVEGDRVLAQAIQIVKATADTTEAALDAEIIRVDEALLEAEQATATATALVRAEFAALNTATQSLALAEIARVDQSRANGQASTATSLLALQANFAANNVLFGATTQRLDDAISTARSSAAQQLDFVRAQLTLTDQADRVTAAANAFQLRQAIVDEQGSRAQQVLGVATQLGTAQSSVNFLLRAANGDEAVAQLTVDSNGKIAGFKVDGKTSTFVIRADTFVIDGAKPFTYDSVNGILKAPNLEVTNLTAGSVNFDQLTLGAAQRQVAWETSGDVVIAQNQTKEVVWVNFTKYDADSVVRVQFSADIFSQDDFQLNMMFQVDSQTVKTRKTNMVFVGDNASLPFSPVARLKGISTGSHRIGIAIQNVETDNKTMTIYGGAILEVVEVRKGSIGEGTGGDGAGGSGTASGGGGSGGTYSGGGGGGGGVRPVQVAN